MKKIESALREKEVLLAEVHHWVKNNLAIINSLLRLEIYKAGNEELKDILFKAKCASSQWLLSKTTIYSLGDFANISFGEYLKKLTSLIIETIPKGQVISI